MTIGLRPVEFKVVIEPKPVQEISKGGIILPDMTKDHEKYAATEGRLVAVAPAAFSYINEDEWHGQKPQVGDKVLYAKYAGFRFKAPDGKEYLVANDKDVVAVIEE